MMSLSKQEGFTLIELLIVLVLVGLTSSVVLPNMWEQLEQVKRYSEKQQLKSLLEYAKQYSIYRGRDLEVRLEGFNIEVWEAGEAQIPQPKVEYESSEKAKLSALKSITFSQLSFERETVQLSSSNYLVAKELSFTYKDTEKSETIEF
ncbi:prepilin-type N-terminal cleavage/methylation domain-containing protein [Pseudoalteromonas sp. OF7H-1]|uniref:prepilin-type N-terminal cleavage/methylation domain-containing protein n=1 Tax=Pseudoalteromonas sp. OF7H-1 TaxID=2917755 RepID=UPI001EF48A2D|nr:prepilin-type N-terminal cleavage/methylation domain-containing protein [Pseudoalteromonas sp. OF7H-1]MCG7538939.1 prepilin-type N-terminal cleavage/methylation domain-containing protein [Pseudoalteromonas sp. OF7H-1]